MERSVKFCIWREIFLKVLIMLRGGQNLNLRGASIKTERGD